MRSEMHKIELKIKKNECGISKIESIDSLTQFMSALMAWPTCFISSGPGEGEIIAVWRKSLKGLFYNISISRSPPALDPAGSCLDNLLLITTNIS